jgi:hypothetical protein
VEVAGIADTPRQHLRVAEALTRFRDEGHVGRRPSAFAMYDPGDGGGYLLTASVIQALVTYFGGDPTTPAAVLIAA